MKIFLHGIRLTVALMVLGCFSDLVAANPDSSVQSNAILFDLRNLKQEVYGFGAHVWTDSADFAPVVKDLRLRYLRTTYTRKVDAAAVRVLNDPNVEVILVPGPWGGTDAEDYDSLCNKTPDEENHRSLYYLKPGCEEAIAKLCVKRTENYMKNGIKVHYVELFNELDHPSCIRINPDQYNKVAKFARAEFDRRGLQSVKIVGPGNWALNAASKGEGAAGWISALDAEAVHAIDVWSAHAWDDTYSQEKVDLDITIGPEHLREQWLAFDQAVRKKDPTKPIFITEYGTQARMFGGVEYPNINEGKSKDCFTHSVPYAARVFENTLSMLNLGANATLIWEATTEDWGLLQPDGSHIPLYYAFQTILPEIARGFKVVKPPAQGANDLYAAAFVRDGRAVFAIANATAAAHDKRICIDGTKKIKVRKAELFMRANPDNSFESLIADRKPALKKTTDGVWAFDVTLGAYSILTVVCDFEEGERK